jgi:hypothetical protein
MKIITPYLQVKYSVFKTFVSGINLFDTFWTTNRTNEEIKTCSANGVFQMTLET